MADRPKNENARSVLTGEHIKLGFLPESQKLARQ